MIALVIVWILVPMFGKVDEVGPWYVSGNNLHQIGIAMRDYVQDHKTFPPAVIYDKHAKPLYSWRVLLLPYLEEKSLYSRFKLDEPWDSANNSQLLAQMPQVYMPKGYHEPGDPYTTPYQVFTGGGAMF